MLQNEAKALTDALSQVISFEDGIIAVKTKDAANEISQLYLDASNYEVGAITSEMGKLDGKMCTIYYIDTLNK